MPRQLGFVGAVLVIVLAVVIIGNPFFIVKEGNQVVITRFGKPISGTIDRTGLHMKVPFIDDVHNFERRLLEWDGDPNQIPTKDKRFIWIDTTARWRIVDPLKYLQTVGNEFGAQKRLDDILDGITRDVITEQLLIEVVRSSNRELTQNIAGEEAGETSNLAVNQKIRLGRNALTREILSRGSEETPLYGIELVDLRIKRIIYIQNVLEKIYERMIAERNRAAQQFRSEGQGRAAEIEGRIEKDLNEISSEAYKKSQEIKGKADAEAASIYAKSYSLDPDFYNFTKTLETYANTIDGKSTLVMTTDGDYFKLLKDL